MCAEVHGFDAMAAWKAREKGEAPPSHPFEKYPAIQPGDEVVEWGEVCFYNGKPIQLVRVIPAEKVKERIANRVRAEMEMILFGKQGRMVLGILGDPKEPAEAPPADKPAEPAPAEAPPEEKKPEVVAYVDDAPSIRPRMRDMLRPWATVGFGMQVRKESLFTYTGA